MKSDMSSSFRVAYLILASSPSHFSYRTQSTEKVMVRYVKVIHFLNKKTKQNSSKNMFNLLHSSANNSIEKYVWFNKN